MKLGKALDIFEEIESDKYTDPDKWEAIYEVIKMPTHNCVSKSKMLKVIDWMFNIVVEVDEEV